MFSKFWVSLFIGILFFGCIENNIYAEVVEKEKLENSTADNYDLIGVGVGMLVSDFFLQTFIHEGTHTIVALSEGYEIEKFQPYPGINKHGFHFGVSGRSTDKIRSGPEALIFISPKFTSVSVLYSYVILEQYDVLPSNQYAQLGLWVFAFGAWIDFTRDVCSGICYDSPTNDLVMFEKYMGYTSLWEKLAVRGTILVLSGLSIYPLYKGLKKVFDMSLTGEEEGLLSSLVISPSMVGYRIKF
ncbi:MAG: hypothetical protein L3J07_03235 [Candidatus Magasanikbacteria bacterium]|nr:hypothetical protein [Candidatus Magasanikbacteria bacterium]